MWNKIYEEENDYQRKRMIFLTIFIYFTSFHTQNETNILFITIITTKQYICSTISIISTLKIRLLSI